MLPGVGGCSPFLAYLPFGRLRVPTMRPGVSPKNAAFPLGLGRRALCRRLAFSLFQRQNVLFSRRWLGDAAPSLPSALLPKEASGQRGAPPRANGACTVHLFYPLKVFINKYQYALTVFCRRQESACPPPSLPAGKRLSSGLRAVRPARTPAALDAASCRERRQGRQPLPLRGAPDHTRMPNGQ